MTLTKKDMIREVGRRTRMTDAEVQMVVQTLIELWKETLLEGKRIELENLFILEVRIIDRGIRTGRLNRRQAPRYIRRLILKTSRNFRRELQFHTH